MNIPENKADEVGFDTQNPREESGRRWSDYGRRVSGASEDN